MSKSSTNKARWIPASRVAQDSGGTVNQAIREAYRIVELMIITGEDTEFHRINPNSGNVLLEAPLASKVRAQLKEQYRVRHAQ